ncbi:MAG: hypothetical protein EXR62_10680 [Chloroflexi bacterium]|nr:hypothetical protein [Chloroflexota bacterium]
MQTMLFFDDWMIERRDWLERIWGKPTFVKEIFTDFHRGALGYGGYLTVFYDERLGSYVMYNAVYPPEADPGTFVVRLQSDDPYNWPNPPYDTARSPMWQGFSDVLLNDQGEPFWPTAIHSLAGTPHADWGYYATVWYRQKRTSVNAFSQDGLHFRVDAGHPWQDPGSDWNDALWNKQAGFYELFTRPVCVDRRISLTTTTDFEHYSPIITVLQPDALDPLGTEFYHMTTRPYEDLFVGMVMIYSTDTYETRRYKRTGRTEVELTYSFNGINWYRTVREPFIGIRELGLQGGGQVAAQEILRTKDNRLLFYISATKGEHAAYPDMQKAGVDVTGYIAPLLYEMRLDGFCSLKTMARQGLLRTKTVLPRSGELQLNVRTAGHSEILVQILDGETAQPIPGYTWEEASPITGDHLFVQPKWGEKADIAALIGRPIRIEVAMHEAELFAIRVDCQVYIGTEPTETV